MISIWIGCAPKRYSPSLSNQKVLFGVVDVDDLLLLCRKETNGVRCEGATVCTLSKPWIKTDRKLERKSKVRKGKND